MLVTEVRLSNSDTLRLSSPVLLEKGQTFWVEGPELVVEGASGHQQRFVRKAGWQGSEQPRPTRSTRPLSGLATTKQLQASV